jgi:hypothetical protein
LPNGTTYQLALTYAAALNVTAASNATEASLTVTNTLVVGDYVEYISSGWTKANNRIFRVKTATGTTLVLEGLDTTSTTLFPAGAGTGTIRKVATWVSLSQVVSCDSSGGDPKYTNYEFLENDSETSIPSGFNAQTLAMVIGDDPSLPHHAALKAATEGKSARVLKAALPAGGFLLYNAYVAFDETPSMTKGQIMAVKAGFALLGRPVRYNT